MSNDHGLDIDTNQTQQSNQLIPSFINLKNIFEGVNVNSPEEVITFLSNSENQARFIAVIKEMFANFEESYSAKEQLLQKLTDQNIFDVDNPFFRMKGLADIDIRKSFQLIYGYLSIIAEICTNDPIDEAEYNSLTDAIRELFRFLEEGINMLKLLEKLKKFEEVSSEDLFLAIGLHKISNTHYLIPGSAANQFEPEKKELNIYLESEFSFNSPEILFTISTLLINLKKEATQIAFVKVKKTKSATIIEVWDDARGGQISNSYANELDEAFRYGKAHPLTESDNTGGGQQAALLAGQRAALMNPLLPIIETEENKELLEKKKKTYFSVIKSEDLPDDQREQFEPVIDDEVHPMKGFKVYFPDVINQERLSDLGFHYFASKINYFSQFLDTAAETSQEPTIDQRKEILKFIDLLLDNQTNNIFGLIKNSPIDSEAKKNLYEIDEVFFYYYEKLYLAESITWQNIMELMHFLRIVVDVHLDASIESFESEDAYNEFLIKANINIDILMDHLDKSVGPKLDTARRLLLGFRERTPVTPDWTKEDNILKELEDLSMSVTKLLRKRFLSVPTDSLLYGISGIAIHDVAKPYTFFTLYQNTLKSKRGDPDSYNRIKGGFIKSLKKAIAFLEFLIQVEKKTPDLSTESFKLIFDLDEDGYHLATGLRQDFPLKVELIGDNFYCVPAFIAASTLLLNVINIRSVTKSTVKIEKIENEVYVTVADNELTQDFPEDFMYESFEIGYANPDDPNLDTQRGASLLGFYLGQQCRRQSRGELTRDRFNEFVSFGKTNEEKFIRIKFTLPS